ncbi:MAG: FecR domain-containing protein [Proteobacteria bacterium]|nr:FecR domain-containing protein [Pseudomonadota bacterium]MBU1418728.1 FecR domain-containing protein [Pseudomonadota bacterium]MBU1454474.1 FecR domain-containing protein [Pseudomonadota bacterium]
MIKNKRHHRANYNCSLSRITWTLLLFILLSGGANAAEQDEWTYSMVRGDNLWNITERYLDGDFRYWNSLIRLNKVTDPKHMPPGSKVRIPLRWLKIDPATVQVLDIHGKVQYIEAQQAEARDLTASTHLKDGDQVMVDEGANVVLQFVDQSRLFLGSGSRVELDRVRKFSNSGLADSKVDLQKGRSESKVKTRNSRFQIKTPSANTAVRGTDFRVTVDQEDPNLSRIEVLGGIVKTSNSDGARDVTAGFGTTVTKGEGPGSLVRLLSTPEILSPPNYSRKLPVDIKWQKVDGAEKYRVQIHSAEGEQTLLVDEVLSIPRFNSSALEDGDYIIGVRAIDANGLEGKNAERILKLDARPQPPLAISPKDGEIVRTVLPTFEWSTPTGGTGYHFQLSEYPDLSSPVIDSTEVTGTRLNPEQLSPGTYYWHLATFADTKKGPFSPIWNFILRPAPKAPDLSEMSTEENETNITLHWQAGTTGQQYKIQLAEDPGFQKILQAEQLLQPELAMERPANLVYFRVKVIDIDGFEGDWSPAQQIKPPPAPWYYVIMPIIPFLFLAL